MNRANPYWTGRPPFAPFTAGGKLNAFKIVFARVEDLKENFDAITNYRPAAVVRRRRRLLRIFQMGQRRRLGDSWNGRADRGGLIFPRRVALTLSGSNGNFNGQPTVDAIRPVVDRTEQIGGLPEVLDCELEEQNLT